MALPSSGQLSINDIRTELGTSEGSLRNLSSTAGFSTPDTISDFYGYSAGTTVTFTLCGYNPADSSGNVTVDITASENVDTNVSIDWTWNGLNSSVVSGTTTIASGTSFGTSTVGGAISDEFNSSLSTSTPSPSSFGTQTYDGSYGNCY
jgi:hypothetical protein